MLISAGLFSPDTFTNTISLITPFRIASTLKSAQTLTPTYHVRQTNVAERARRADETTLAGDVARARRVARDRAAARRVLVSLGRRRTQRAHGAVRQCSG